MLSIIIDITKYYFSIKYQHNIIVHVYVFSQLVIYVLISLGSI